nr:hypothetical protein [Klebsiella pneumoniae]
MINKLHNLEKVMDSTFATGHSTWLRYVLRNSVSTLGDLKIAAKQVCSSNTAKDESTELQCSIAVSYCSTLQSISIIFQVAVELETLHQNDAFLRSTYEYLKRNGIYDHDIIFDMLKKVSLTDCEKFTSLLLKRSLGWSYWKHVLVSARDIFLFVMISNDFIHIYYEKKFFKVQRY